MENKRLFALQKSLEFIGARQNEKGYWEDFHISEVATSNQWVTAYISYALLEQDNAVKYVKKAAAWLLATELPGGGWGYNNTTPADADSTSNVLRLLASFNETNGERELLYRLADFLISFQDNDTGGFVTYRPDKTYVFAQSGWCRPEVSVTAMAGAALLRVDKERYLEVLLQIKDFLLRNQLSAGCWESYWWNGRMYGTSLAVSFLWQIGERTAARKGLAWIIRQQDFLLSPFNKALALFVLEMTKEGPEYTKILAISIEWLTEVQQPDGGWSSDNILKVPNPYEKLPPWERPGNIPTRLVQDQNRLFTTATVIRVLRRLPIRCVAPLSGALSHYVE